MTLVLNIWKEPALLRSYLFQFIAYLAVLNKLHTMGGDFNA